MSNVVTIGGTTSLALPEPSADLIERLEELLALARTGEMRGIAYAAVYTRTKNEDPDVSGWNTSWETGWIGVAGTRLALHSATACLFQKYTGLIMEHD